MTDKEKQIRDFEVRYWTFDKHHRNMLLSLNDRQLTQKLNEYKDWVEVGGKMLVKGA